MGCSIPMTSVQFVSANASDEEQQQTRRVIRRHVMLGKNRGRPPKNPRQPKIPGASILSNDTAVDGNYQIQSRIAPPISSDLSLLEFPDKVGLILREVTVRFCTTTSEYVHFLDPCVDFNTSDDSAVCLWSLFHDALYMNIMVFGAAAFTNIAFQQATSQPWRNGREDGMQHYGQALRLLRERLAEVEHPSSGLQTQGPSLYDTAVTVVLVFAMHALTIGNFNLARCHLLALSKLVTMRKEGLVSFRQRTKQMIELMRCDLSISLATGQLPVLLKGNTTISEIALQDDSILLGRPVIIEDFNLCQIWSSLDRFFGLINNASVRSSKLPDDLLRDTIYSVVYGLFHVSCVPGSQDELIRLTMLSFCSRTVLQWPIVRFPFPWLKSAAEKAIDRIMQRGLSIIDSKTRLWVLIIHGIAFTPQSPSDGDRLQQWLTVVGEHLDLTNWAIIRSAMRGYLWVDIICNEATRKLLEKFQVGRSRLEQLEE
ncbi:hypothetical protein PV08_05104 [Exophiala spinifera]|uniref:Transcription factor domain-containing protein n=1 Tax=Exophiala spinifera TaxID=91928 RepID=A0A0D2C2R4_9EURO|nr:uncharacterized protein PV08_05104 [Exophiala spinifera]KIW17909.1 hypothetical protein PV08_05104 [Exophiala spinifera]